MVLLEVILWTWHINRFYFSLVFQLDCSMLTVIQYTPKTLTISFKEQLSCPSQYDTGFCPNFPGQHLPTASATIKMKHIAEAAQSLHLAGTCLLDLFSGALKLLWQWRMPPASGCSGLSPRHWPLFRGFCRSSLLRMIWTGARSEHGCKHTPPWQPYSLSVWLLGHWQTSNRVNIQRSHYIVFSICCQSLLLLS